MPVGLALVELLLGTVGTDPVDKGLVELLAGTVGAVPVDKGWVDLATGPEPVEKGAVPVYLALVLLPRDEIGDLEAGADENDGDGMEVPLVVAALPDSTTEPLITLGMIMLLPLVGRIGAVVAFPVLVGAEELEVDEFG